MSRLALLSGILSGVLLAAPFDAVRGQSEPPADSGLASALLALRDSVVQIRFALNAFQRDLPLAGPETVVRRAAALNRHCVGLVDASRAFGPSLMTGRADARDAADQLNQVLARLRRGLDEHCLRGLSADGAGIRPDTLRAWGPHRVAQIERLLAEYDQAAHRYARVVGVKLEPKLPQR